MKAALVTCPGILEVRDIQVPEIGDYDVLCEILYCATCAGTDLHLINGTFPFPVQYPTVLGHESIGRVVAIGPKVHNYKIGDKVTKIGTRPDPKGEYDAHWGGFSEFGIAKDHWAMKADGLPQNEWYWIRSHQIVPEDIDPAEATMIITWRETLSYLVRMGMGEGHSVLVIGSGGNGFSFAVHAVNRGASEVVMIGSEERRSIAETAGTAGYFNYKDKNLIQQIKEKHPSGFDIIIDSVGKKGQLNQALPLLKPNGTIGIYGLDDYEECVINPRNTYVNFSIYNGSYDEEEVHEEVIGLIRSGKLKADLWMNTENVCSIEEIGKAFEMVSKKQALKVLVKIR